MRILVTGGQGQVGSEFENLDVPDDIEIVALGRVDLDIVDAESIANAFAKHQPDLLVNAAAYTAVDKAESEPGLAFEINETAVGLLADACVAAQIPMFHISTDYVFDGEKAEPYTEDDPVNPISAYGKSKEAGERALRARLENHIILRTSWVFATNGPNFVKTMLRLASERDPISVVDDQVGGPTSALSIARCLVELAIRYNKKKALKWGTYHFSQLPHVSWYEFAWEIVDLARDLEILEHALTVAPIPSSAYPTDAPRPKNSRLNSERINQLVSGQRPQDWRADLQIVLSQVGGR